MNTIKIKKIKIGNSIRENIFPTKLFSSMKNAISELSKLDPKDRSILEKEWDVEHAYYSSALEGSKLDKEEFEKLGNKID